MEKTNKELRYDLLQANRYDVEKAKQCYDFVQTEDTETPVANTDNQPEGIYLIYADGHREQFNGNNEKDGVKYVGVVSHGHSFAVSLTESEGQLLPDDAKATKREDNYKTECEAIYDFDSAGNTAKLMQDNPKLADHLKEGEAIPALGVLVLMYLNRAAINAALSYVGGQTLTDNDYWSSTEYSEYGAWYVNFNDGGTWNNSKYNGCAVRAVAAF